MASSGDDATGASTDIGEQIRQLREQLDHLLREHVTPGLTDAAARMQDAAQRARTAADAQTEALAGTVRQHPISAVLIAAAVGFVLGRATR